MKVGIDIGGSKILLLAYEGNRAVKQTIQKLQRDTGSGFNAAQAETMITEFLASLPGAPNILGIAIPGLVDENGAVVACDVLPGLVGWQPRAKLPQTFSIQVMNDAAAATIAATAHLSHQATAVVIMVGTGIGAGFLVNGQLLQGAQGWAGELGSIPMAAGQTLDRLASGAAILERLDVSAEELNKWMTTGGDTSWENRHRALQIIQEAGTALGLGIATAINLFNPEAVIVGGGTLRWPGYWEAAVVSAKTHSLPDLWATCDLQQSSETEDLVAIGATIKNLSR